MRAQQHRKKCRTLDSQVEQIAMSGIAANKGLQETGKILSPGKTRC